jgi:hypothetical protein
MSDLIQARQNLQNLLAEIRKKELDERLEADALAEINRLEKAKELGAEGLRDYRHLLRTHDWWYDFSDDHRVWQEGSRSRNELNKLQEVLDPDFKIWDDIAPEHFRRNK